MSTDTPALHDTDHRIELPDGRLLAYREHSDQHGIPVFYFHGFPGSRLEAGYFPAPGIRLIAVDRPGYGLSSPSPKRRLTDWPSDIAALADKLGLSRFCVLGISGGAPYAAACAHALTDRIAGVALVCGLGPPEAPGMTSGRLNALVSLGKRPMVAGAITALARQIVLRPSAERQVLQARARSNARRTDGVPKERAARTEEFSRFLLNSWREGLKHTSSGMASDARVYGEPWPFSLADIRTPIALWHGTDDRVVPVSIAHHYAEHIPGVRAHFCEGDGHFSVIGNALHDITEMLKAAYNK